MHILERPIWAAAERIGTNYSNFKIYAFFVKNCSQTIEIENIEYVSGYLMD